MPRDQETTSFDQAPSTSRYPFGSGGAGPDDTATVDDGTVTDRTLTDRGAAADSPDGTTGRDAFVGPDGPAADATTGANAAGMDATAGADTTVRDGDFAGRTSGNGVGSVPHPEEEWIAGSRDPAVTVPSRPVQPAAEDTRATGTRSAMEADIDPHVAKPLDVDADASPAMGTAPEKATAPATGTTPGAESAQLDRPPTGAHAAPTAMTPGSAGAGLDVTGAAFVADADGYRASWVRIQSGFVDDPRGSVTEAADLIARITAVLVAAVEERERSLRGGWDSGRADTEGLRNALREYRSFFERLMKM